MSFPEGLVQVFVYGQPVNLRLSFDGLIRTGAPCARLRPVERQPVRIHQSARHANARPVLGSQRLVHLGKASPAGAFHQRLGERQYPADGLHGD